MSRPIQILVDVRFLTPIYKAYLNLKIHTVLKVQYTITFIRKVIYMAYQKIWQYLAITIIVLCVSPVPCVSTDEFTIATWNMRNFVSKDWWCPYNDMLGSYRDITHSNTIYFDADDDIIYYNSRNTNTFFKLNHTSKKVIWGLGEYGNFTMYDIYGNQTDHLFFHAHSVEPVDENTFILFDNDLHNQTDPNNERSRILEITIDEETMTANESWYYAASSEYYSAYWGDADRLPKGNRLGTWGYHSTPIDGPCASLIEVDTNHEVVWQVDFPYNDEFMYGTYRMERFRFNPIISSPDDIVSSNSTYTLSWDVWYNHRNKRTLPGNYTFYIDGFPAQNGFFNYTKYWRPTTINIDTGLLDLGTHNLTIEVYDDFGNKATDSLNLTLINFNLIRTGLTTVEKGQAINLPTWSGFTTSQLFCNITLNGTLYEALNWTGQDIVLDPVSISLGAHLVQLQLYNGSEKVYEDSFWLQVDSTNPPLINPLQPTTLTITWGDTLFLAWELVDSTPTNWTLLVNDEIISSSIWIESPFLLNWSVPTYPEGTYNLTLLAIDLLGARSKSETILTINPTSYPYILSTPRNQTIAWGTLGVSFEWETYNAESWELLRNGTLIETGDATSGSVSFTINDWQIQNWRPGIYELMLSVTNENYTVTESFWLEIVANPGDSYADAVVTERSDWYIMGDYAVGEPDGLSAVIYVDYADGYLSLDMGEDEEIIDGSSDDFTICAYGGGEYRVSVVNSLSMTFQYIGNGTGIQSFDLAASGLSTARYVRVTYVSGPDIELDAVVDIHYNTPPLDTNPPRLTIQGEVFSVEEGSNMTLMWTASDETAWSYEVYLNSTLMVSEFWNGSDIHYLFRGTTVGCWNVTLVAYDAFDNIGVDIVLIEVYARPGSPSNVAMILIAGCLVVGVPSVSIIAYWIRKQPRIENRESRNT